MASNPSTLYFRRQHETGLPDATPFTGSFTRADPYVLHDGALGDSELALFQTGVTTTYTDFGPFPSPTAGFLSGLLGLSERGRTRGRRC